MNGYYRRQSGFALIVSLVILAVLTILVVNSIRNTTLNEQMSGSYMERTRVQQIAEQALRQGEAILVTNGATCLTGCTVSSAKAVAAASAGDIKNLADVTWVEADAATISGTATGTSGKYLIRLLNDNTRPSTKTKCKSYSIMGKGVGLNANSQVILQTVALLCPV